MLFFSLNVPFYIPVFVRLCPNQQTRWGTILHANLHNDKHRLSRTYAWVQLGRDVTRLYDGAFPADLFQCELRKSSLLFCSDFTGANQNVGHCLSMWDMRQGMEMLCSPTQKVEPMISEYFQEKNEFIISPIVAITEQKNILWFTNGGEPLLFCQWR